MTTPRRLLGQLVDARRSLRDGQPEGRAAALYVLDEIADFLVDLLGVVDEET